MSTKTNEVAQALQDTKPTIVEFYTAGDPRSEETLPIVTELSAKTAGKANVITVETTANPDLVTKYHIHAVPTWILFRDGQEAWRSGGRLPLSELEDMVARFD